jgi:hypothetical protein
MENLILLLEFEMTGRPQYLEGRGLRGRRELGSELFNGAFVTSDYNSKFVRA